MVNKSKKEYSKKCTKQTIYNNYFTVVNGLLHLTKKEISIVARLYYYDSVMSESVSDAKLRGVLLFSPEKKAEIIKDLGIKPLLLNNYIASLKDKGIILVTDGIKWLNPKFLLDIRKKSVEITYKFLIEEEAVAIEEYIPEEVHIPEEEVVPVIIDEEVPNYTEELDVVDYGSKQEKQQIAKNSRKTD